MKNTVVIVTYNRIELLKECLGCVLASDIPFCRIIVVDNACTDGTSQYLDETYGADERFIILHQEHNLGGAGGFYAGLSYVQRSYAQKENVADGDMPKDTSDNAPESEPGDTNDFDYLLIIDDDAMIEPDYMTRVIENDRNDNHGEKQKSCEKQVVPFAGAGIVVTNGRVDITHRRKLKSRLLFLEWPVMDIEPFECEFATFCGLVLNKAAFNICGLPREDFFLWYDDSEYCLRLFSHCKIKVNPKAVLNHKTRLPEKGQGLLDRITWRQYYGYRNRYFTAKEHLGADAAALILFEYRLFYIASFFMSLTTKKKEQGEYNMQLLKDVIADCKAGRTGIRDEYKRQEIKR